MVCKHGFAYGAFRFGFVRLIGKFQGVFSDGDHIPVQQLAGNCHGIVHEGPVFALEIGEDEFFSRRVDFGVVPRYGQIVDDHVIVGEPSDGQGFVRFKGELAHGALLEFQGQNRHVTYSSVCGGDGFQNLEKVVS